MPLIPSRSKAAFHANLTTELAAGKPMPQAFAIAHAERNRSHRADGGSVVNRAIALAQSAARTKNPVAALAAGGMSRSHYALGGGGHRGPNPMLAAQDAGYSGDDTQISGGLVNSSGPGRTDIHNASVPSGSYVFPADVVSGLGDGNTMAGAKVIDLMLNSGPYGTTMPHVPRGPGVNIPHPPAPFTPPQSATSFQLPHMGTGLGSGGYGSGGYGAGGYGGYGSTTNSSGYSYASGGQAGSKDGWVPIVIAGGEYVVPVSAVAHIGGGDISRGHSILDAFVSHIRKKTVKSLKTLPGPIR